jgi:hypothetical protein
MQPYVCKPLTLQIKLKVKIKQTRNARSQDLSRNFFGSGLLPKESKILSFSDSKISWVWNQMEAGGRRQIKK